MQYIDNDMDDLFKKAGQHYPLKTDGSDWNALHKRLQEENNDDQPTAKGYNSKYLWLLLLIIPVAVLFKAEFNSVGTDQAITTKTQKESAVDRTAEKMEKRSSGAVSRPVQPPSENKQDPNPGGAQKPGDPTADKKQVMPQGQRADNEEDVSEGTRKLPATGRQQQGADNKRTAGRDGSLRQPSSDISHLNADAKPDKRRNDNNINETDEAQRKRAIASDVAGIDEAPAMPDAGASRDAAVRDTRKPTADDKGTETARLAMAVKDSAAGKTLAPKVSPRRLAPKLYFGLVAGPDLSVIKSQASRPPGYSAGLLAGYRLDRHWAIEAGALWSKKKYFTSGKHFDIYGTNIPSTVIIDEMDGSCEMFEFPVTARYNFEINTRQFFVTSGLTSYVMKKESYHYSGYVNGSYYKGYRAYDNSGNHVFSNLQFSIGYDHRLSPRSDIRIEPYLKIPVSGVGIGNMPITSAGIYFGLIHSFNLSKN